MRSDHRFPKIFPRTVSGRPDRALSFLLFFCSALLFLLSMAAAQDWENPKEVYGADWECSRMQVGNPTFETCKKCDERGGTFYWKQPAGATALEPRLDYYTARCLSPDGSADAEGLGQEDGGVSQGTPSSGGADSNNANSKANKSSKEIYKIKLCNDFGSTIFAAADLAGDVDWTISGWYNILPGQCAYVGRNVGRSFYYFAKAKDSTGTEHLWTDGDGLKYCLPNDPFTKKDDDVDLYPLVDERHLCVVGGWPARVLKYKYIDGEPSDNTYFVHLRP